MSNDGDLAQGLNSDLAQGLNYLDQVMARNLDCKWCRGSHHCDQWLGQFCRLEWNCEVWTLVINHHWIIEFEFQANYPMRKERCSCIIYITGILVFFLHEMLAYFRLLMMIFGAQRLNGTMFYNYTSIFYYWNDRDW